MREAEAILVDAARDAKRAARARDAERAEQTAADRLIYELASTDITTVGNAVERLGPAQLVVAIEEARLRNHPKWMNALRAIQNMWWLALAVRKVPPHTFVPEAMSELRDHFLPLLRNALEVATDEFDIAALVSVYAPFVAALPSEESRKEGRTFLSTLAQRGDGAGETARTALRLYLPSRS